MIGETEAALLFKERVWYGRRLIVTIMRNSKVEIGKDQAAFLSGELQEGLGKACTRAAGEEPLVQIGFEELSNLALTLRLMEFLLGIVSPDRTDAEQSQKQCWKEDHQRKEHDGRPVPVENLRPFVHSDKVPLDGVWATLSLVEVLAKTESATRQSHTSLKVVVGRLSALTGPGPGGRRAALYEPDDLP
ncbi:MAG: hypothetical protein HYZ58_10780 [Acidobacteria bacterium]|nr:hypothetical protein [Acidobacteriota bacterium]